MKWTAKTAETKTILPFAMKMLEQHAVKVGQPTAGRRLASGSALLDFIHWLQVSPTRPSTAHCKLTNNRNTHKGNESYVKPKLTRTNALMARYDGLHEALRDDGRAGINMKPKHHLGLHMPQQAPQQGNPSVHATWLGETPSRILANMGQRAHRAVWELRILEHFEQFERRRGQTSRSGR